MIIESTKDKANLVSGILCVLGLIFIIIGSIPMTFPLSLILGLYGGFGGLIVGYLFPVLLILLQAISLLGIVMNIIKKETMINPKTGGDVNIKKSILVLAIINLFFILLCVFLTGIFIIFSTYSTLLIVAPFITIAAGLVYQNY